MFSDKKYVGVALESDAFKVVEVEAAGDGIRLLRLDYHSLVEPIGSAKDVFDDSRYGGNAQPDDDEVFGFEDVDPDGSTQEQKEVDFKELEAQAQDPDIFSLSEMDGDEKAQNNIVLLYNILSEIGRDYIQLATNIPAGNTIFQTLNDTHYNNVKEQQIVEVIEDKLQAIYGVQKSSDNYAYEIREDGSMILASIDDSAATVELINETKEFYRGRLRIEEVYPDEVALVGLFRANYNPDPADITAIIQFAQTSCRIVFLQGDEIFLVTALINSGTASSSVLNVVFSKLLLQLDSGEVPELDQIILANNSLGKEAVDFFRQNFSDIEVEEFRYKKEFLDSDKFDESALGPFTTAIALGAAALRKDSGYPELSMLPERIKEEQKIFKLQWHGMVLLVLIFLTLPITNYFYQQNEETIEALSTDLEQTESRIVQLQPIVQQTNETSQNLSLLVSKLGVLDSLSRGSKAWSEKLNILNEQMDGIPNSWFISMAQTQEGAFLEGYTLYRNRIPAIVDIFAEATLLNVNTEEVREKETYKFSMIVQEFAADTSVYSPDKPNRIREILNN